MSIRIGIDIGSVSLKIVALGESEDTPLLQRLCDENKTFRFFSGITGKGAVPMALSECRPITRNSGEMTAELLEELYRLVPESMVTHMGITGSNGDVLAETLGLDPEKEIRAVSKAIGTFYPDIQTIFEIGGRAFNFIPLEKGEDEKKTRRRRKRHGAGACEEGIGFFLEQQADRMKLSIGAMGEAAAAATQAPRISRGCSVFIKSDMIHSQQKGYSPEEVLRALCESVAIKFKNNAVKGQPVIAPVALIGGVSQNKGVVKALLETFGLGPDELIVPELYAWCGAVGAAMGGGKPDAKQAQVPSLSDFRKEIPAEEEDPSDVLPPLSLANVTFLKEKITAPTVSSDGPIPAFLGIDIGSVSTKLAVIDEAGNILQDIYLPTSGRPVEAVTQGMADLKRIWGDRLDIQGMGTTGSGRELIAEIVGADTVTDEITAHKTGAVHISSMLGVAPPDTIFEIGGQDSKYIYIEEGAVTDFAMNEACAAGTGSFLAEQAETLNVLIREEFATLALSAPKPSDLGEFCTVVIAEDLIEKLHEGETIPNLLAGLSLAVARNYLNLVVRRRPIGKVVYFQGGTASNQAVAAAFGQMLGRPVIVPPYNGVIGAMGAAVIARDWVQTGKLPTAFRGLDPQALSMSSRNFTCKGCNNCCDVKEMLVEGKKSYWGNRCADRYGSPVLSNRVPVIPDLIAFREKLFDDIAAEGLAEAKHTIGIPRALTHFDLYPFWHKYLTTLGMKVVLSPASDPKIIEWGQEIIEAQFCHPVSVAFGHVKYLTQTDTDYILIPGIESISCEDGGNASSCSWMRMLPHFVTSSAGLASSADRFLTPAISFRKGKDAVKTELFRVMARLGVSRMDSDAAAESAFAAQQTFRDQLLREGKAAVETLKKTGAHGILLVGRSYTLYDRSINCDTPRKLRARYGANVIPFDFLPGEGPVSGSNLPWESGVKIEIAARLAASMENLHMIYNCSFPCGPDAEIKPIARKVSDKPVLFLQFDGNGYDAGYMTRCEAFLASKGILQCAPDGETKECSPC